MYKLYIYSFESIAFLCLLTHTKLASYLEYKTKYFENNHGKMKHSNKSHNYYLSLKK
jgi:hypothetical protein